MKRAQQTRRTLRLARGYTAYDDRENTPGCRSYFALHDASAVIGWTHTAGAVELWNPEQYDEWPLGHLLTEEEQRVITARYDRLPTGPNAAHYERARLAAHALSDGAYVAVQQLDEVFHLRSGERSRSPYAQLRRAHDVAQPKYEWLRMALWGDYGVPYFIACEVAARVTRWLDTVVPLHLPPF